MAKKGDLLAAMDRIDAADPCPTHGKATLALCDHCLSSDVYCEACQVNPCTCRPVSATPSLAIGTRRPNDSPP
jgi:hypothetical protein